MTGQLEGRATDPYGRHEARWLSDGHPTKLVRYDFFLSYRGIMDVIDQVTPGVF